MTISTDPQVHLMSIGGASHPASGEALIESTNPATGQVIGFFPAGTREDVDSAVAAAQEAFPRWSATPAAQRGAAVSRLAAVIAEHAEELALLDCRDNGSLLSEMHGDVASAVAALRYFAGLSLHQRGETIPSSPGELTYSVREPFGVVGRIVPFNHPFMFAASKIAAPLVAGNTVVLKPSEHTSLSALRLGELATDVLPDGVLNVVTGLGIEAGDALVAHPGVRRLAFTGSVATGLAIQRRAAESTVKAVSLELGGKNPLVVHPDADLDLAVEAAVRGMNFTWQGQSCGSLSRVIVHTRIHDEFADRLTARVAALRPGPPEQAGADTGAIVHGAQFDKVMSYVQLGIDDGATLRTGGTRVTDGSLADGWFLRPAVFSDVQVDSRLAQEEIFGPVMAVLRFEDEADSIRIANATTYGLTASVFTGDLGIAHRFAAAARAGYVWVNEVSRHLPGASYGGVKNSGIGREESFEELLSYTQTKNVHINFGV